MTNYIYLKKIFANISNEDVWDFLAHAYKTEPILYRVQEKSTRPSDLAPAVEGPSQCAVPRRRIPAEDTFIHAPVRLSL